MSSLSHLYHLYADGQWEQSWFEHLKALNYGLMDELSNFYVCIIGSQENQNRAIESLPSNAQVVLHQNSGWEQASLQWIHDNIDLLQDSLLYCHSKGAGFPGSASPAWRRTMTHDVVINWAECIEALKTHDAVGTWWHEINVDNSYKGFFAGNFWWATSQFLSTLNNPLYRDRYDAEIWLGSNFDIKPKFLRNGHFNPGLNDWNELWV
jgi:hypothetical protein